MKKTDTSKPDPDIDKRVKELDQSIERLVDIAKYGDEASNEEIRRLKIERDKLKAYF